MVHAVRQRDVDGVQLVVAQQRLVRAVGLRDPLLRGVRLRLRLVAARDGDDVDGVGLRRAPDDRVVDLRCRQQAESHAGSFAPVRSWTGLMCGGGAGGTSDPAPVAAIASPISRSVRSSGASSAAAAQPSTWPGRRAPTILAVTPGCASTHAIARAGNVVPSPAASCRSRSTSSRFCERSGSRNGGACRRAVVLGEARDAVAIVGAGEQPRGERRVAEHAGAVLGGPRHDGREDATGEQRERRLHRVDVPHGLAAVELLDVEVAGSDPADLPLVDEGGHRPPRLLEQRPRRPVRPVTLVEVDPLEAEPAQAALALLADRLGAEVVPDLALRPAFPPAAALREHEHVVTDRVGAERPPDDLLGVTEAVDRRGVDPVDPELDRAPDRGDRLVVVDRSPPEPPRPADAPGAEADHAERRAVPAEAPRPHTRDRPCSSR